MNIVSCSTICDCDMLYSDVSAVATVEATEADASVKILTGAIIISVIKITIVTFNANSTI